MIGIGAAGPMGGQPPVPDAERRSLAVLVSVQGLGPLTLDRLRARLGSATAILDDAGRPGGAARLVAASADPENGWRAMPGSVAEAVVRAAGDRDRILGDIERLGLQILLEPDVTYPARLRTIEIPPAVLFVRGDLAALNAEHAVAVVGTRRPTEAGRRTASRIAAALARAGTHVVSGLAVGIDGAAHEAVVHSGGRTVAFIGSGHARLFPAAHARLAGAIVEAGGAIVSEYAPETEPTQGTFPRRNRLISGAADAVVVVEAGARSGALLTASWALEQGRECFLVPGPIDAPASAGCNGFLRDWPGLARIVAGVPQLLDDLGLAAVAALPPAPPPKGGGASSAVRPPSVGAVLLTTEGGERAVAEALVGGAVTVDEIVAVTGLTVGAVLRGLTRLETDGLVVGRHGRYRTAGRLSFESLVPPAA